VTRFLLSGSDAPVGDAVRPGEAAEFEDTRAAVLGLFRHQLTRDDHEPVKHLWQVRPGVNVLAATVVRLVKKDSLPPGLSATRSNPRGDPEYAVALADGSVSLVRMLAYAAEKPAAPGGEPPCNDFTVVDHLEVGETRWWDPPPPPKAA
jgi:hypothetical protein